MGKYEKLMFVILTGKSDNNISFVQVCKLLVRLRFLYRVKGSHHIFYMDKIDEIINIQPIKGKAKPYQVRQIRALIIKYKLNNTDEL